MSFKALLVIVRRELFAAHGAHLPVTLNMFFKLALIIVRRKHHFTKGTLLDVHKTWDKRGKNNHLSSSIASIPCGTPKSWNSFPQVCETPIM